LIFRIKENTNSGSSKELSVWTKTTRDAAKKSAAHVARYILARKFTLGKYVCDVACGTGYGSHLLSYNAESVVGIDISEKAISWAAKYFGAVNIRFMKADISEKWPIEDKFGIITSFETMEHIVNPQTFVRGIYEHLRAGGMLILSVPNGPRDQGKTDNPCHLHHFTDADFKSIIETHFSVVEYFSQAYKKGIKHYGTKLLRKAKLLKKQPYFTDNYFLKPGLDSKLKTWIAIAKK